MNKKLLNELVSEIAEISGQATNKEQAILLGRDRYLYLEFASHYGGYRLVNVGVNNGAHYGAFGGNGCETRLSAKHMATKLQSIKQGILSVKA